VQLGRKGQGMISAFTEPTRSLTRNASSTIFSGVSLAGISSCRWARNGDDQLVNEFTAEAMGQDGLLCHGN